MQFPHQADFRYRKVALFSAIIAGAVVSFFWKDLPLVHRIAAPCSIILFSALQYWLSYSVMNWAIYKQSVPSLPPAVAYVMFYAFSVAAIYHPLSILLSPGVLALNSGLEEAITVPGFSAVALSTAGGVYRVIDESRNAV